jgi:hypothetical protein
MSRISDEQRLRLRAAILEHEFLHRTLRQIEALQRVVFHAANLEWGFVRAAAEEILIADIVTRYQGNIDGVYFALRKIEETGKPWQQAISEYAAYIHNYYTMPLGVVLRKDLFGKDSHFITPNAGKESILHSPRPTDPAGSAGNG